MHALSLFEALGQKHSLDPTGSARLLQKSDSWQPWQANDKPLLRTESATTTDSKPIVINPDADKTVQSWCLNLLLIVNTQVSVERRSFTYDYVYGWGAAQPDRLYEQCVLPLVGGLFKGYNATVFAYGKGLLSCTCSLACSCHTL